METEYCQQIRRNIKNGKPVQDKDLRHIDTADFWKEQYTRIHLQKKALENRVESLEESRVQLLEKLHGNTNQDFMTTPPRNSLEDAVIGRRLLGIGSRKRRASDLDDDLDADQSCDWEVNPTSDGFLEMSSYGKYHGLTKVLAHAEAI